MSNQDDVQEFTIDGVNYKAKKMNCLAQARVFAVISPLIAGGGPDLFRYVQALREQAMAKGAGSLLDFDIAGALERFGGFAEKLAQMKPEAQELVFSECLSVVNREIRPNNWGPIWIAAAKTAADPALDSNLFLLLRIIGTVIQGQLSSFFPTGL